MPNRRSSIVIGCLAMVCLWSGCLGRQATQTRTTDRPILVYCAAGIRLPVEEAAKQYEAEFGRKIMIDYGSSGELEGRLEIDRRQQKTRCDLYIPADESFVRRTQEKNLTAESLRLAKFRLVLAVAPDYEQQLSSIEDVLRNGLNYVVCDTKAGVGKKTMTTLQRSSHWERVNAEKKASFPRVTEAANAVKTSRDIQAGFIWDTTAQQFGLRPIVLEEIAGAESAISANIVRTSTRPTQALHFARYLAARDKGQMSFPRFGFEPIGTDAWSDKPELVLYCGGVNRNAIDKTLREFESREGVQIKEQYGGCGTLVSGITSIAGGNSKQGMPDAFMTCDTSYMEKVKDLFEMPADVSSTNVVMLVRKGNPRNLKTLKDLAQPGLAIGTTDPMMSTLGNISWQLFDLAGVKTEIEQRNNVAVTTPTAHELIMQMLGHDKLDVALVYEANCQNLPDEYELVPIDYARAKAIQNIATSRDSKYPALAGRLIQSIMSDSSQKRFELQGFEWQVQTANP